ncbi:MAG: hypothetical protein KME49_04240 [Brasilonema octagenarum HA4186-MV1]|jgi:hypothetical protein|uniref:Uncharacterized protein n=2 Tax=Brasilonema TaxID=383614 RepID=A0A856MIA4_9CYAN|nr:MULTISPECIES: hypothetical protein [Brasilonema]MBW4624727.1 hypothetical protein [Brasilonema octagenarum HA4186-MV1]NMF61617.1 hypothetical protein [Brasilonema octagenarum UFV-OR1]QDL11085.1 hypothetical protein DP114_27165 [Brasilonema sennae CENA114]QDL17429.1 hypothetical protein DP113_27090 [Brasilonema octagenarum UFV-E1]
MKNTILTTNSGLSDNENTTNSKRQNQRNHNLLQIDDEWEGLTDEDLRAIWGGSVSLLQQVEDVVGGNELSVNDLQQALLDLNIL